MSHISPFFVLPGEGASMDTLIDAPVTIKAGTRSTNGSLAVLEFVHGPKAGPPLHTHLREDEMWYVLQGDYRFKAGDSTFQLSTGGMAFAAGRVTLFPESERHAGADADYLHAVGNGAVLRAVR